jgi:hypothetical protein
MAPHQCLPGSALFIKGCRVAAQALTLGGQPTHCFLLGVECLGLDFDETVLLPSRLKARDVFLSLIQLPGAGGP